MVHPTLLEDPSGEAEKRGHAWRAAALFAVVPTVVGMADAAISIRLGGVPTTNAPSGWAPQWLFPVVWLVLYPTLGLSAWSVWRERTRRDVSGVLALFATYFVGNLFFMPISSAIGGKPIVLTMMDLNGVVATALLAFCVARTSTRALHFIFADAALDADHLRLENLAHAREPMTNESSRMAPTAYTSSRSC